MWHLCQAGLLSFVSVAACVMVWYCVLWQYGVVYGVGCVLLCGVMLASCVVVGGDVCCVMWVVVSYVVDFTILVVAP